MYKRDASSFSVLTYAGISEPAKARIGMRAKNALNEQQFGELVESIRAQLMQGGDDSERRQNQYLQVLNRAVLGFAEDRSKMAAIVEEELVKRRMHHYSAPDGMYRSLAEAVFAEIIGLNVLEVIMANNEALEEIQVIGCDIFEVQSGRSVRSAYRFKSIQEVERIQQNLVLFNQDRMTRRKRWAEVQLTDGSRVTMTGFGFTSEPTLTIRFYHRRAHELARLSTPQFATLDDDMKLLLLSILRARLNIVIIGPTNSGKTHLMKALIAEIHDEERIVTMETRRELMLKRDFPGKNVIEYEVDEEDAFHSGKRAFKLALRQSPERIIQAEIRDEDANIYVRACTRGHDGSMTTVHASNLEDVPDTIAEMCMMDGRVMNPDRLRLRIATHVSKIGIQMATVDGQRKIVRIVEYETYEQAFRLRNLAVYQYEQRRWEKPESLTKETAEKMMRSDKPGYLQLRERGWIACK